MTPPQRRLIFLIVNVSPKVRTQKILVCFTAEEREELLQAAERHGLRPSTYVRVATLQQVRGLVAGKRPESASG